MKEQSLKKITPFKGGLSNADDIEDKNDTSIVTLDKIFKNKDNINAIINYINGNSESKAIILRGDVGVGKLTLVQACLKKCGYTSLVYNEDFESEEELDNLFISLKSEGISKIFFKQKRAIIIHDIDNILKVSHKKLLFKFLLRAKNIIPLIMTSTEYNVGTVREVPSKILQLTFEKPYITDLVKLSSDIVTTKGGNVNISKYTLEKIVKDCNFDIRTLINTIHTVVLGNKESTKSIKIKNISDFTKDHQLDTFKSIEYCADKNKSFDSKIIYTDTYTNSTVYHNYINMVPGASLKDLSKISDIISFAEEVRNYVNTNQLWDTLDESYSILGTLGPLSLMSSSRVDKLTYPPNYYQDTGAFKKIEEGSYAMKYIIKPTFFEKKTKKYEIKDQDTLKEYLKCIEDPVSSYKLSAITDKDTDTNAFVKALKSVIVEK